jgi:hypothetical protein
MILPGKRGVEHDREMLRPAQGERHVALAGGDEALPGPAAPAGMLVEAARQLPEALGGDGGQQALLIAEVAVGSVVGDAGHARHLAQGEGLGPGLGDQPDGGLQQYAPQIAVMVGAPGGHGGSNVDRRNMEMQQCCHCPH